MYMISSNLLLLCNINYNKSWIYSNLMEIGFYSDKRKNEKKNHFRRYDLNLIPSNQQHGALASTAIGNFLIQCQYRSTTTVTFNVLKVSQSRAIIDRFCQDEGFELTYYIETLVSTEEKTNFSPFIPKLMGSRTHCSKINGFQNPLFKN